MRSEMPPFPFFQKGGTYVGGALEPPTYSTSSKTRPCQVNCVNGTGSSYKEVTTGGRQHGQ